MSLNISQSVEARLAQEAQRRGLSIEALLELLIEDRVPGAAADQNGAAELPVLHLGPMGPLHRRDIYENGR